MIITVIIMMKALMITMVILITHKIFEDIC